MPLERGKARKVVVVANAQAAGSVDFNCTGVNTTGYSSVEHIAVIGALTATQVTNLQLQHSDTDGSYADITGAATGAMADGDSNNALRLEIIKPTKAFLRCVVERATENAVIESVIAILDNPDLSDITDDASVAKNVSVIGS